MINDQISGAKSTDKLSSSLGSEVSCFFTTDVDFGGHGQRIKYIKETGMPEATETNSQDYLRVQENSAEKYCP